MGLVHLLANGLVVTTLQSVRNGKHAVYLAKDELGTLDIHWITGVLDSLQMIPCAVAQGLGLQFGEFGIDGSNDILTTTTTVIVWATNELVLHTAVDEHEAVLLGVPGEILEFAAAAVEAHQVALLAKDGCELVHDAAVHADIVVLGSLANLGKLHLLDLVVTKLVVDGECERALKGCARRHACTKRHITCKSGVEALYVNATLHHLASYAEDIAEVAGMWSCGIVDRELVVVLEVGTIGADDACAIGTEGTDHALLDSTGEYEATIVVGVLAYKVDTTWRSIHSSSLTTKMFCEFLANCLNVHDIEMFLLMELRIGLYK